ncbi:hypothetical protein PROFUN_11805 [Planoprotostelium fungivorum]|uniref:Uncharacterized protein n=1 Tax=Planoprotostelium fungivorum TaxID=1890364 RepID=A0A2P6MRH0_9EUKA|nr:hypothetical protein PROFUN_11805 [Planoprotostelium fungivorum]
MYFKPDSTRLRIVSPSGAVPEASGNPGVLSKEGGLFASLTGEMTISRRYLIITLLLFAFTCINLIQPWRSILVVQDPPNHHPPCAQAIGQNAQSSSFEQSIPPQPNREEEKDDYKIDPSLAVTSPRYKKRVYDIITRAFPYDRNRAIPNIVWRSWKSKELNGERTKWAKTWEENAKNWNLTMLDDKDMEDWMQKRVKHIPCVMEAWELMPQIILRSDFFRYLILFVEGDTDTSLVVEPEKWVPAEFGSWRDQAGLVANEQDQPSGEMWARRRFQIVQYCMMFKKGHPALANVITSVIIETMKRKAEGKLQQLGNIDILEWTGPALFTDDLFNYWNRRGPGGLSINLPEDEEWNAGYQGEFSGSSLSGFTDTQKVGDLILLHRSRFWFRPSNDSFIVHHCSGSWKGW